MIAHISDTYTSTSTVIKNSDYTSNEKMDPDYQDPSKVLTTYRYRTHLEKFDISLLFVVKSWCEENCLRKFELIPVTVDQKSYTLVCAFEKKIDCVGFKIRWL